MRAKMRGQNKHKLVCADSRGYGDRRKCKGSVQLFIRHGINAGFHLAYCQNHAPKSWTRIPFDKTEEALAVMALQKLAQDQTPNLKPLAQNYLVQANYADLELRIIAATTPKEPT